MYGNLVNALEGHDGDREIETESEAVAAVRRMIGSVEPTLLVRLDFDEDADGTGISAPAASDLKRSLEIIGIPWDA